MLILTRKVGESVLIGDDISITVLSVRGNQVKLGVSNLNLSKFNK